MSGLVVDLFAGGGGASRGIEAAGLPVDVAINHDEIAIAVHAANHPGTEHLTSDLWTVKPRNVTRGRPVRLLWASPDCRHFSNAKGGVPCHPKVRALASLVIRWAEDVRPDVILLENVQEFQTWGPLGRDRKPIKARRGENWRKWVRHLQRRGYVVDWRVLDASEFGAPTRRRRLFVVARCDGQPISWPAPTHGPGRLPLRTAAECIDWSLPCPSIFGRRKPLVEKTLWRIAQGLKRFVFENPRPFILKVNHGKWEPRHESIDAPLSVVTATQRGHALVAPTLQQSGYGERPGQRARVPGLDVPIGTLVNGQKHALVAAFLAKHFGDPQRSDGAGGVVLGQQLDLPIGTVTTRDHHSLVTLDLETNHECNRSCTATARRACNRSAHGRHGVEASQPTRTATDGAAPARDSRQEWISGSESKSCRARVHDVGASIGLDCAQRADPRRNGDQPQGWSSYQQRSSKSGVGDTQREHEAFLSRAWTQASEIDSAASAFEHRCTGEVPQGTGSEFLCHRQGTRCQPDDGISGRAHVEAVRSFLALYSGTADARHRLGLVTVEGVEYQITDIGFRMLEPHELLRAQFGAYAADYDLSAATTKKDKIRLIGNSVCPEVAEALVRVNLPDAARRAA